VVRKKGKYSLSRFLVVSGEIFFKLEHEQINEENSMTPSTNPFRIDGKVALITGAARGIGASCARTLAASGATVVISDIDLAPAESVLQEIQAHGGNGKVVALDVTSEDQWVSVINDTVDTFGGLDIVVNNAGAENMNVVEDLTLDEWNRVMGVNSDGVFLGVKHAMRAMKPGGIAGRGGSIINIASICAMVAFEGSAAYSASKAAVTMLTKVAAVECGKRALGIRVNSIHPGVILTDLVREGMAHSAREGIFESAEAAQALYESQHPIGNLGQPEDVANAVLYLASDASQFTTGSQLVVDGGYIAQ
jgi:NAD(P)-dependent dehydrogenase (short-subunit alcohol dehydrogenase family)